MRIWLSCVVCLLCASPAFASGGDSAPHWLWMSPFVLLLASIALMPFINKHWWEKWYPAVAIALGAVSASYYLLIRREPGHWVGEMQEYVSFICLLGSLFVISGGIVIHVGRTATPAANSGLLLIGAIIANIFGTTGASMLLIRPYLRMNKGHIKPYHIVFFIFLVSNIGGSLTPIGDPPLFLGYLKGVPFWWVWEHCNVAWMITVGIVLAIFFVIDALEHKKSPRQGPEDAGPPVTMLGLQNIVFIVLVLYAVFQPGIFETIEEFREKDGAFYKIFLSREILMVAATGLSLGFTPKAIHNKNEFSYGPIKEVAILFIGIFSTMTPALHWLGANAHSLPLERPAHFYYSCGTLSSVLDNAPTYLTFLKVETGKLDAEEVKHVQEVIQKLKGNPNPKVDESLAPHEQLAMQAAIKYHAQAITEGSMTSEQVEVAFLLGDEKLNLYIVAISLGAVFFGAITYIGNGPNFMVKSIAESSGAQTPDFITYVWKYALPILIPTYVLVQVLMLRG